VVLGDGRVTSYGSDFYTEGSLSDEGLINHKCCNYMLSFLMYLGYSELSIVLVIAINFLYFRSLHLQSCL